MRNSDTRSGCYGRFSITCTKSCHMSCSPRLCHVSVFHCATCQPQFVSSVRSTSCHNVSCVLISCHVLVPNRAMCQPHIMPPCATCHTHMVPHARTHVDLTTISTSCQVLVPRRVTCRSSRVPKWHVMPRVDHPAYPSDTSCSVSSILRSKWLSDTCQTVSCHAMCQHNIMPHFFAPRVCVWACHDIATCQVVWHVMPHVSPSSCHVLESLHVVCHISI